MTINYIASEQSFTIYPKEKKLKNGERKIPLIVKPSEDVNQDREFVCSSYIQYHYSDSNDEHFLEDEDNLPKVPAGTKGGNEIEFNCKLKEEVSNKIIVLITHEATQWKIDENNNQIKFVSTPTSGSNNLNYLKILNISFIFVILLF